MVNSNHFKHCQLDLDSNIIN